MPRANLSTVTAKGDRRQSLERLRQVLAEAIDDGPPPRDLASLSRRLMSVLAELEALSEPKKGESPVDELRRKRAAREAAG